MEIHTKCNACEDPTKYVSGFWDGKNGSSGAIYDCKNEKCEIKILSRIAESEIIKKRAEIQAQNGENGVYVLALEAKRRDKGVPIKEISDYIGISPSKWCDYSFEREVMPKELYDKALECVK